MLRSGCCESYTSRRCGKNVVKSSQRCGDGIIAKICWKYFWWIKMLEVLWLLVLGLCGWECWRGGRALKVRV